ncbi:MAG TPA: Fur family transcriptional regulator [Anaerolineae bacterium]|nr:Fur family transcriptional regulator [Anaerolineae bacterium]
MSCHQHVIDQLRGAGVRLTPQRALVLDVVYHSHGHLTADQVYERVRTQSPQVDLSTVYRNLVFLRQQGLIGELRLEGEPTRFEAVRSGAEHHHAVCSACGAMIEIAPADLAPLSEALVRNYGFAVSLVHLTLNGHCAACQPAGASDKGQSSPHGVEALAGSDAEAG